MGILASKQKLIGILSVGFVSIQALAVMEVVEVARPIGVDLVIFDFPNGLHLYEGRVTPGQRIPEWADAFRAALYPHTFETFEEWRTYFGHGPKEDEYMVENVFNEAREVPVVWPLYKNDSLTIPYAFSVSNGEIEYLVVPYRYSGNARYPDSIGKVTTTASQTFLWQGEHWKMLVGDTPEFVAKLYAFESGRDMVDYLETGECDGSFDFTVHYESFPEYDPNAVLEQSKKKELFNGMQAAAPRVCDRRDTVSTADTKELDIEKDRSRMQWWHWMMAVCALLGAGAVFMRLRR